MSPRLQSGQVGYLEGLRKEVTLLLLILLALLAIILFGVGFTVHWLFILAVIAALVFVIMFFMGAAGGRSRGAWW